MPPKGTAAAAGGKSRRRGKKDGDLGERTAKALEYKEDGQEYGKVIKMLGSCRIEAYCSDGVARQCTIRGKMRKKVWIRVGDVVLVSLREFQDGKGDVIHKYSPDEARQLKKDGEITERFLTDMSAEDDAGPEGAAAGGDDDAGFEFAEFDDKDIDDL